jgi:hypothetical protein
MASNPNSFLPRPPCGVRKVNRKMPASKLKAKIMRTLSTALRKNPKAELLRYFPKSYTEELLRLSIISIFKVLLANS